MAGDVVIVGGGIIGGSIAWRLAQRGLRVEIFDAGRFGGEASSAGAGMLAPGAEVEQAGPWSGLALESLAGYAGFVAELEAESGVSIDYRRCGANEVAIGEREWTALRERAARQRALGIAAEELRDGAMHYPDDALVEPRDVLRALRAALMARGVPLHEGCPVAEVHACESGAEIVTAGGRWRAGAVVLAAGAWSSQIAVACHGVEQVLPRAMPVRGHLVAWTCPPGTLGPILRHRHTYLLQRSSGRLIAGTSSEQAGFDRNLDPAIVADIAARARALLPGVLNGEPEEAWIGFRPGTVSGAPALGRWEDSPLWLAYGHYRNGILMAPATARRISSGIISSLESGLPGSPVLPR